MHALMEVDQHKIAVHFGAGNIGRGFIGKILSESGYQVVFVDVQEQIINALHDQKKYIVEIAHPSSEERGECISESEVSHVDGVISSDQVTLNELLCKAELLTTAVGPNILTKIAPIITTALKYRYANAHKPLNIIACENKVGATDTLKEEIQACIKEDSKSLDILQNIGFANCGVDRIVVASDTARQDLLRVRVEEYFEWTIDETRLVGPTPPIRQAKFTNTLDAYLERKLFILNTGHCMLAYLATIENIDTIDKAIFHPKLSTLTRAAMLESAHALSRKWGLDIKDLEGYAEKILIRFRNSLLGDTVVRVAREPLRKLGPQDRFMRPISYCQQYGLSHDHLLLGVAAGLYYAHETDKDSLQLQNLIQDKGLEYVLSAHCQIAHEGTRQKILHYHNALSHGLDQITI